MVVLQYSDSDISSGGSCYSSCSSSDNEYEELNPTQLLSLAIKKRRAVYNRRERDFRQELLHTGLIQSLCKYLGEARVKRRRHRRSKSSRNRSAANRKREWSDNASLASPESATVELTTFTCPEFSNLGGSFRVKQPHIQCSVNVLSDCYEPPEKKPCRCDHGDPFGLEPIFKEMFGSGYIQVDIYIYIYIFF